MKTRQRGRDPRASNPALCVNRQMGKEVSHSVEDERQRLKGGLPRMLPNGGFSLGKQTAESATLEIERMIKVRMTVQTKSNGG